MSQPEPLFTVEDANALLPKVEPLIKQLQGLQDSILKTNAQIDERVKKLSQGNGYPIQELRQQVTDLTEHQLLLLQAFQSAFEQLQNFGCSLKDLQIGLVDFQGLRAGEVVCWCWKLGEARIQFWHRLEDGSAGRQPL